jgi:hypothetical protein
MVARVAVFIAQRIGQLLVNALYTIYMGLQQWIINYFTAVCFGNLLMSVDGRRF